MNTYELLMHPDRTSFSISETALILRVPQCTIEKAIKASSGTQICDGLPVIKPNGRYRVLPQDLRKLLGLPIEGVPR